MASPQSSIYSSQEILSPGGKSRYGRTRRPKITQDFCNIDDIIIDDNPIEEDPMEEVFELGEGLVKFKDLGIEMADNFKTIQRGLDYSIKERKCLKDIDKLDMTDLIFDELPPKYTFEPKTTKTPHKTYLNRRKHQESDSFESFGLPDEPIVPIKGPTFRPTQIDIDINAESDVTLIHPWSFDEFFTEPIGKVEEMNFERGGLTHFTVRHNENREKLTGKKRTARSSPTVEKDSPIAKKAKVTKRTSRPRKKNLPISPKTKVFIEEQLPNISQTLANLTNDIDFEEMIKLNKIQKEVQKENTTNGRRKSLQISNFDEQMPKNDRRRSLRSNLSSIKDDLHKIIEMNTIKKSPRTNSTLKNRVAIEKIIVKESEINKDMVTTSSIKDDSHKVIEIKAIKKSPRNNSTLKNRVGIEKIILKESETTEINKDTVAKLQKIGTPTYLLNKPAKISETIVIEDDIVVEKESPAINKKSLRSSEKLVTKSSEKIVTKDSEKPEFKEGMVVRLQKMNLSKYFNKSIEYVENSEPIVITDDSEVEEQSPKVNKKSLRSNQVTSEKVVTKESKTTELKEVPKLENLKRNLASKLSQNNSVIVGKIMQNGSEVSLGVKDSPKIHNVKNISDIIDIVDDLVVEKLPKINKSLKSTSPKNSVNSPKITFKVKKDVSKSPKIRRKSLRLNTKWFKDTPNVLESIAIENDCPMVELPKNDKKFLRSSCSPIRSAVPGTDTIDVFTPKKSPKVKDKSGGPRKNNKINSEARICVFLSSETKGNDFEVGDLVWAKIGKFPYWPSLITKDKISGTHAKIVGNRHHPLYHVRFFGDNGRRSWVSAQYLMPYSDKKDLQRLAEFLKENKSKSQYIKECCFVRTTQQAKWENGVSEAESMKDHSVKYRLSYFVDNYDKNKDRKQKRREKRKRTNSDSEYFPENESKQSEDDLSIKIEETPRHNSLRREEYSEEQLEARKKLRHPQIRNEEKNSEVIVIPETPKVRNKKQQMSEITNSDTDSKFSDNSSVPPSMESQIALYKRNNIFRGVPKDKVCQICEKTGEVFKCKGPCSGNYHPECTTKGIKEEIKTLVKSEKSLSNLYIQEKIDFGMKQIMADIPIYCDIEDCENDDNHEVTATSINKGLPYIKHVTADAISYLAQEPDVIKQKKCSWCESDKVPPCCVCGKEDLILRKKCSLTHCGKFYHLECLKSWPQTQWSLLENFDSFVCPRHVCHTCISDNPSTASSRCNSDTIVTCLRCPATYHSRNYCVPAGTQILTTSQIICPRHTKPKKRNYHLTINANWCFICSKGGNLICCDTCPTSVHAECLPPDFEENDTFFCEDCQSGRFPLYDEIVWVKLGSFRWWPAVILFPNDVPDNVKNIVHDMGEFVVKFYGTYDHYWVGRGRTFLFQEGDKGHSGSVKKRVDSAFIKAIEEATAAFQLKKDFKERQATEINSGLKPPHYIKIKVNKPVGNVRVFDGNISCTQCECDPNQPNPCGPDSNCLNRLLLTECNPKMCPARKRCKNQCFEKREYPPLRPHRTEVRGWGLKTLAPIRKGEFVIEYVGEMIDEQEYQRRIKKMHEQKEDNYYFLTIDKDRMLDAGPKGNYARFMNHSCQPNCETQKWTVNGDTRVGLFANCDIEAGAELTFNYNLECIGKEKKICLCGAPNCSGFIGVKVKTENASKKSTKPKKKKVQVPQVVEKDNPCFVCGKLGDVKGCNNNKCTKYYHLVCVGLKSWPERDKFVCQWHNCNLCSKRTTRGCIKCLNSYCPSHSSGNIRYDKFFGGFLCTEHDPTKEQNAVIVSEVSPSGANDENMVTSTTTDETTEIPDWISGYVTSTPVKKTKEYEVTSTKKTKKKNTASVDRFSRTRNGLKSVPETDLPIRKRTRLRFGNSL